MVQNKELKSKIIKAKALFPFIGKNNDELSFSKGDDILITQAPGLVIKSTQGDIDYNYKEEDWWEGLIDSRIGWFPCNYIKIVEVEEELFNKSNGVNNGCENNDKERSIFEYYTMVIENTINLETNHVAEIHALLRKYLRPLHQAKIMQINEYYCILSNLEQIALFHTNFLNTLQQILKLNMFQQRIGGVFLKAYAHLEPLIKTYCSNHPSAVRIVVDTRKDAIQAFLSNIPTATDDKSFSSKPSAVILSLPENSKSFGDTRGTHCWQIFCAGLSLPFRHLEKYPNFLRELYRLLPDNHIDKGDTQRAIELYSDLLPTLHEVRKQKEFEIEILVNPIEGWEGEAISSLGTIVSVSSVKVLTGSFSLRNAVVESGANDLTRSDRYFVLFPSTLLIISPNQRLNGFIYRGKIPLSDLMVDYIKEPIPDGIAALGTALVITGPLIEPIVASCGSSKEREALVETLRRSVTVSGLVTSSPIEQKNDEKGELFVNASPTQIINEDGYASIAPPKCGTEPLDSSIVHALKTEIFQPAIPLNAKVMRIFEFIREMGWFK